MTDLRLVLLLAGALAIALLWYLDARRERMMRRQRTILRRDAGVEPTHRIPVGEPMPEHDEPVDLPPMSPRSDLKEAGQPTPEFAAVLVLAQAGSAFEQQRIFEIAEAAGLEYVEQRVFAMPATEPGGAPLFSMANLHEPGTFTRAADARSVRGAALIMRLPVSSEPAMAADLMLHTADLLADGLGGVVCGADRSPLDQAGRDALRRNVNGSAA